MGLIMLGPTSKHGICDEHLTESDVWRDGFKLAWVVWVVWVVWVPVHLLYHLVITFGSGQSRSEFGHFQLAATNVGIS